MYHKHKSKYLLCILYEDLAENPAKEIEKLLEVLSIPSYNIAPALEALKVITLNLVNEVN